MNEFVIEREYHNSALTEDGYDVGVLVDTKKSKYHGMAVRDLGRFGRRKFENLLVLQAPTKRIKVLYG